jgi:hypothetical protein
MKKGKVPDVIACMNCGHRLFVKDYIGMAPNENTPQDHIHRTYDKSIPQYSVMCTCGHFMINDHRNQVQRQSNENS